MIHVRQEEHDPLAVRVSAGHARVADGGYVVYRGTLEEAIACLTDSLAALNRVKILADAITPKV